MPVYTFHLLTIDEVPVTLEIVALRDDAAAFAKAGELLDEHQSCDQVEVWADERAVVARHCEQPIIRPPSVRGDGAHHSPESAPL
jgi:hypothetical protein